MRHLISPMDLSARETDDLLSLAGRIMDDPEAFSHICDGKKLAALFFEPSTRTRLSFESAMLSLGGQVLGFSSADSSSAAKGETVSDTARVVSCYADIIAMRHPVEGAAAAAAAKATVPVINAGDGGHHHPTQTLTDLLTIHRCKGGIQDLTVGLCGDLKYGRTVHSLIKALCRCKGIRFLLVSPPELRIPDYIREDLIAGGFPFQEAERLEDSIGAMDVLYMTRVQRERFASEEDYLRLKDSCILDGEKMRLAKADMIVLHPLPRVNEIAAEVDDDPRAMYFEQVRCGKFVRMALILKLLGLAQPALQEPEPVRPQPVPSLSCGNPRCITAVQPGLPHLFHPVEGRAGSHRCAYCDHICVGP